MARQKDWLGSFWQRTLAPAPRFLECAPCLPPPPAIQFQNVSKSYRNGQVRALDGVSFEIQPGEFFGLLGPNGAGKTTLISILAGLARASGGSVRCWATA